MAANFEIHIDARAVEQMREAAANKLRRAAEIVGGMMETNAKKHVKTAVYSTPHGWYIRTGNLRNRITHEITEDEKTITITVGSEVEYAPYVELGTGIYAEESHAKSIPWRYQDDNGNWHTTSGMKPRPFLRPALENHVHEYIRAIEAEMQA